MNLNEGQKNAIKYALEGRNLAIFGLAGTGKSTVINIIEEELQKRGKRVERTAPTGAAAELIKGRTINSFLSTFNGIYEKPHYENHTYNLRNTDVVIVDEISLLSAPMLMFLYHCIAATSHHVQVIALGDFNQLKPVMSSYAFKAKEWAAFGFWYVFLEEVVRQNDVRFIENLKKVAEGDATSIGYFLNNSTRVDINDIYLCPYNKTARKINTNKIAELDGTAYSFLAQTNGSISFRGLNVLNELTVKCGMRVMAIVNNRAFGYQNGSMGIVTGADEDGVYVRFDSGNEAKIGRHSFEYDVVSEDDDVNTVTVKQIPIIPAYAITIHKSQGMTLERANVYSGGCISPGQLYTALSRVKSVEGIHLIGGIWEKNYVVDPEVKHFYLQVKGAIEWQKSASA